ncbi:ACT domain-containing ACR10 [Olea europaea subsp. europaea]|uniref:ACT domain-containing protein ACR n=1 Tax=Olea europaea subsp. europaea TaxID=158383 RepID=A0A8S0QU13_OLEEU|nr:ACT domain-containing ACR10 [Olea europaea subsp. europaea]
MGILYDDLVIIRQSETEGEPSMITVNCPDKTGLGCDLCRIFLFFGLTVARIDVSTDGKWCYLVFWVIGKPSTRWDLLTKRLLGACPSFFLASGIPYYEAELQPPRPPDVFLLKFCYLNRKGLLHVYPISALSSAVLLLDSKVSQPRRICGLDQLVEFWTIFWQM